MNTISKTRALNHRAVLAGFFGLAGILLGASAFAQDQSTPPGSMAALPDNGGLAATPNLPVIGQDDEGLILATVNDEPITKHDVEERLKLALVSTGINPPDEEKARMRQQILKTLESEALYMQEARRKGITVSPNEVEKQIAEIAQSNGTTLEQLNASLSRSGASMDALRRQLTASLAWRKTIQDEFGERILQTISEADVDAAVATIAEGATKPRFRVAEIFLGLDDPKDDAKIKKEAEDILEQIKAGANFQAVARQFSQNPSAASGGDIGWVVEGQIAEELSKQLAEMKVGMVSPPIKSRGGYYILVLIDREEPAGTQVVISPTAAEAKPAELPLVRVLLPLGNNPSKEMSDQATKFAAQFRLNMAACGPELQKQVEQFRGIYMDLGMFDLTDLSPQIQTALGPTRSGEPTQPLLTDAGVELFLRCDPRQEIVKPFQMPTREQVENQIYTDRITAQARGYERDLRRSADVQLR